MIDRICTECGTKVLKLWENGDCDYSIDLLVDDAKEEYGDYRNMGYTWYCTDKSCDAGTDGWFGYRTDCPPKADKYNPNDEIKWEPKGEMGKLMGIMIKKNLDLVREGD